MVVWFDALINLKQDKVYELFNEVWDCIAHKDNAQSDPHDKKIVKQIIKMALQQHDDLEEMMDVLIHRPDTITVVSNLNKIKQKVKTTQPFYESQWLSFLIILLSNFSHLF